MEMIRIGKWSMQGVAACVLALALGWPASSLAGAQEKANTDGWKLGSEVDVLPYAMKGYYGSGFMGRDGWKYRYVVARSTTPSFMVSDGFKEKRTDAYALLTDRFLGAKRQQLQGFWVGGGAEYWRNRIRTEAAPEFTHYQNYMLTAGGGYVWQLSRHFYINPWVAGHFVVANSRKISVSGKSYEQPVFTPEGSVKIGFTF